MGAGSASIPYQSWSNSSSNAWAEDRTQSVCCRVCSIQWTCITHWVMRLISEVSWFQGLKDTFMVLHVYIAKGVLISGVAQSWILHAPWSVLITVGLTYPHAMSYMKKNISSGARQAILRSLDSAVSSLLALISRDMHSLSSAPAVYIRAHQNASGSVVSGLMRFIHYIITYIAPAMYVMPHLLSPVKFSLYLLSNRDPLTDGWQVCGIHWKRWYVI